MYVYLIFDPFSRLVKIGKSINPKQRFNNIKSANPSAELFYFSKDYTEAELHERFKEKREGGEWFALDKKDIFSITKTFQCIPKRLHYSNTKKDKLRIEINKRKASILDKTFITEIKFAPQYKFTTDKKLYNCRTGREIKKTVNG